MVLIRDGVAMQSTMAPATRRNGCEKADVSSADEPVISHA